MYVYLSIYLSIYLTSCQTLCQADIGGQVFPAKSKCLSWWRSPKSLLESLPPEDGKGRTVAGTAHPRSFDKAWLLTWNHIDVWHGDQPAGHMCPDCQPCHSCSVRRCGACRREYSINVTNLAEKIATDYRFLRCAWNILLWSAIWADQSIHVYIYIYA